jgi:hypothetical protein
MEKIKSRVFLYWEGKPPQRRRKGEQTQVIPFVLRDFLGEVPLNCPAKTPLPNCPQNVQPKCPGHLGILRCATKPLRHVRSSDRKAWPEMEKNLRQHTNPHSLHRRRASWSRSLASRGQVPSECPRTRETIFALSTHFFCSPYPIPADSNSSKLFRDSRNEKASNDD